MIFWMIFLFIILLPFIVFTYQILTSLFLNAIFNLIKFFKLIFYLPYLSTLNQAF
jgi:hypothetical protein